MVAWCGCKTSPVPPSKFSLLVGERHDSKEGLGPHPDLHLFYVVMMEVVFLG
jgi:hypothetical protein